MQISSVDYRELLKSNNLKDIILDFDLTYLQYRMLNEDVREFYIKNKDVPLNFAIQYCRDNKDISKFIRKSQFEVVNDIKVLNELVKTSPMGFNFDWSIVLNTIYNSYVTRMLNSTATNWNINDYINFYHTLEKEYNFNSDLWELTSKVLYKSNELMGDDFINKKFYVLYIKPHLTEFILPHHLNQCKPFLTREDKEVLKEAVKTDSLNGYFIKEEILQELL